MTDKAAILDFTQGVARVLPPRAETDGKLPAPAILAPCVQPVRREVEPVRAGGFHQVVCEALRPAAADALALTPGRYPLLLAEARAALAGDAKRAPALARIVALLDQELALSQQLASRRGSATGA